MITAVRRQDRHEALAGLEVADDRTVVNVMAGVANDDLRRILATDAALVRAIPLPSVRERRSVTVTFPSHPVADALFERLGGTQPVADETAFDVFSALTGTLTTHYAYLAALTSWAIGQGIPADYADRYVRGLFQGVGRTLGDGTRPLDRLAADHETPSGNNERIRTTWFTPANSEALTKALDDLLTHLKQPGTRGFPSESAQRSPGPSAQGFFTAIQPIALLTAQPAALLSARLSVKRRALPSFVGVRGPCHVEGEAGEVPALEYRAVLGSTADGVVHATARRGLGPLPPLVQLRAEFPVQGGPYAQGRGQRLCAQRVGRVARQSGDLQLTRAEFGRSVRCCRALCRSVSERTPHECGECLPRLAAGFAADASGQCREGCCRDRVHAGTPSVGA
ncbi:hypothetical protein [Streptomyces sp. NBC_01435]|uniref:hypothetical protein n=1 Tax=Streptomyces sp. NBC_01435 TaxID=2903865 RepID=UPI002E305344|nr:hypothetical protein [Streptomyces sp. NBC_01435]